MNYKYLQGKYLCKISLWLLNKFLICPINQTKIFYIGYPEIPSLQPKTTKIQMKIFKRFIKEKTKFQVESEKTDHLPSREVTLDQLENEGWQMTHPSASATLVAEASSQDLATSISEEFSEDEEDIIVYTYSESKKEDDDTGNKKANETPHAYTRLRPTNEVMFGP